jgi:hypothetical protein
MSGLTVKTYTNRALSMSIDVHRLNDAEYHCTLDVFVPMLGWCRASTRCIRRFDLSWSRRTDVSGRYGVREVLVSADWTTAHVPTLVRRVRRELVPRLLEELAMGGSS